MSLVSQYLTTKNVAKAAALFAAYKTTKVLLFPSKVKSLQGKTVLITGSATGLGRVIATELAKQGEVAMLILWDIQKDEVNKTSDLVKQINPNIKVVVQIVNLASKENIYSSAKDCVEKYLGGNSPDVIVNNAGIISGGAGLLQTADERIELEIKINTLAHVWMAKAFLPKMIESRRGGHFVNVASMAAYVAASDMVPYAMSKKGAKGFAEGLNAEIKQKGLSDLVKVTLVCPSHIDTALFKGFSVAGSMVMTPEYVAQQLIKAIECETELVQLPKYLAPSVIMIGINEFWGKLNLPSSKKSPMSGWSGQQADKIFESMKKSSI